MLGRLRDQAVTAMLDGPGGVRLGYGDGAIETCSFQVNSETIAQLQRTLIANNADILAATLKGPGF